MYERKENVMRNISRRTLLMFIILPAVLITVTSFVLLLSVAWSSADASQPVPVAITLRQPGLELRRALTVDPAARAEIEALLEQSRISADAVSDPAIVSEPRLLLDTSVASRHGWRRRRGCRPRQWRWSANRRSWSVGRQRQHHVADGQRYHNPGGVQRAGHTGLDGDCTAGGPSRVNGNPATQQHSHANAHT